MPTRSYIPVRLADQRLWVDNFCTFFDNNYAAMGFSSVDNDNVQAARAQYDADYDASQTAATRTPVTIATFVTTQTTVLATIRIYAQGMNNSDLTNDTQRASAQITIRKTTLTKITAPLTWPVLTILAALPLQHKIIYRDSSAPTLKVKAKPFGATACALFQHIGATPPPAPSDAVFVGLLTKCPFYVDLDASKVGQTAYYYARWVTARGLEGPLVGPVSMTIAA